MGVADPARGHRRVRTLSAPRILIIVLALAVVAALLLAWGIDAAGGPRAFARSIGFARDLQAVAKRLGLAYPTHAALGTLLNVVGPPHQAASQWIRAASHADLNSEIDRAASGIAMARSRAQDVDALDADLCDSYFRRNPPPSLLTAADRAGLRC
jgi:hypothetical protein